MNGWHHVSEEDEIGRTTHFAVRGEEKRVLHWSPFKPYTAEHFRRYVALGFPAAPTGNLFPDEIDRMWADRPRRRDLASFNTADLDHVLARRPLNISQLGI